MPSRDARAVIHTVRRACVRVMRYRDAPGIRVAHDRLAADREPKFAIVFKPANDEDSRPYLQTLQFQAGGIGASRAGSRTMVDRRYRVGIVNHSSATVPDVSLTLQSCNPAGNFVHVGHRLLVMDTDPPLAERDLLPSKNGEPTLYFDVVNELGHAGEIPSHFLFCYANPGIVGEVPPNSYEIVLRADGGNVSLTKTFRVRKRWNPTEGPGRLLMEAV